jgi:hypothetical protein
MTTEAVRIVETATALLLRARQAVQQGDMDEATEALRTAVCCFARAYLVEQEFDPAGDRPLLNAPDDDLLRQFFDSAPDWLGAKVAVLLRKVNYLTHAAPYMPPLDDDGEWDARALETEVQTACRETGALFGYLVRNAFVPDFRGEVQLRFKPGDWVEYAEFDWGTWHARPGVVLEARWPTILVRYEDRRLDELDLTIAYVRPLNRPPLALDEELEARRTAFERLLYYRELDPEPTRPAETVLGPARHLRTCPCCGYPTRRLRMPDYARLIRRSYPVQPACTLCGWNDLDPAPEDAPDRAISDVNPGYSLSTARQNFADHHTMFAATDSTAEAVRHRGDHVRRMKANAIALLDGILDSDARRERDELWRAACSILRQIGGEQETLAPERASRDSRIGAALRSAASEL